MREERIVHVHSGMTTGQRWFLIIVGTLLLLVFVGNMTGSPTRSNTAAAAPPSPAAATSQGASQAPQPTTQTVLGYVNNDYLVGTGEGMIPPGQYRSSGDSEGFTFSMWTSYSDTAKQHPIDFGSIGKDQQRFMNVAPNAKLVSLTGDAVWIKVG